MSYDYYMTAKLPPYNHQMTLEELFSPTYLAGNSVITHNISNTRTIRVKKYIGYDTLTAIKALRRFNADFEFLRFKDRHELYREFKIPKRSGGLRTIDAPNDELKAALIVLKQVLEGIVPANCALYHTSAFAYVKNRCPLKALQRHQRNNSKWFAKFDLSNFFGSTTYEFVLKQLEIIYPFCHIMGCPEGREELSKAIELCFLDGVLPQGTPISPMLTNLIMIPIDYKLNKVLSNYKLDNKDYKQKFIYTRYADDFTVSSEYDFNFREIEQEIKDILLEFKTPYILKSEKTRYGSSSGQNWNLGLMLNKDNEITVGHKRKKELQVMLFNYGMDKKNNKSWSINDVQSMEGLRSYYTSIEGDTIDKIVDHVSNKLGLNLRQLIKDDLAA